MNNCIERRDIECDRCSVGWTHIVLLSLWAIWLATFPIEESTLFAHISGMVKGCRLICLGGLAVYEIAHVRGYTKEEWLAASLIALVGLSALISDNTSLFQTVLCIFCLRRIDPQVLLRIAVVALLTVILIIVAASISGIIPSGDWQSADYRGLRRSFGFVYPSRLPNYALSIALTCMVIETSKHPKAWHWLLFALTVLTGTYLFWTTKSRNPFVFTMLAGAMIPLASYLQKRMQQLSSSMAKRLGYGMAAVFILSAAGIVLANALYQENNPIFVFFNNLLSGRLSYSHAAMEQPLTLLGSSYWEHAPQDKFTTGAFDSSYLRLIYYFGLIPSAVFLGGCCYLAYRASVERRCFLCLTLFIAALHGIMEGQLYLLSYSPFLVLFGTAARSGIAAGRSKESRLDRCEKSETKHRMLVVAQSPLQLISSIAYIIDAPKDAQFDLIVYNIFSKAEHYARSIREAGLFNNVYLANDYGLPTNKIAQRVLFTSLIKPSNARCRLKESLGSYEFDEPYDYLAFSSATLLVHDLRIACLSKNGSCTLLDDGMGTYTGGICFGLSFFDLILSENVVESAPKYKRRERIKKCINRFFSSRLCFNINEVAILGPTELIQNVYSSSVIKRQIPLSNRIESVLRTVFQINSESRYKNKSIVFFSLPEGLPDSYYEAENRAVEVLRPKASSVLIRPHPRRRDETGVFSGFEMDTDLDPWEILLFGDIDLEDKTLIGFCSTAQLSPALLADVHPTLILLDGVVRKKLPSDLEISTFKLISSLYKNNQKMIKSVTNIKEFESILKVY